MKFLLVQSPLLGPANYLHLTPPLGLLSIGAVLQEEGVDVAVLDLNLKAFQDPSFVEPATFYDTAAALIASHDPDVVGFTSMALESHVCLELARRLKRLDPQVVTLFGGSHFSSIAVAAMKLYSWMDYVVTGAAETALVTLSRYLCGADTQTDLTNIAHRQSADVVLGRRPVAARSLDELPRPAHDLVNVSEYFKINPRRVLCIEHARGCQLRCAFCYSEAHWGHGENRKSIERTIVELTELAELGASHVFFVADNFVTNREQTERLCAAIEDANLNLTWQCYATLAQLDERNVRALASAGCNGVFVGVDAVSSTNKRVFRKTYFKGWDSLRGRIETCLQCGVVPTCSFMLSVDDNLEGVEATLTTTLLTKLLGAQICLNVLAVYNESELERGRSLTTLKYSTAKPRLLYDTLYINCDNPFAERNPEYFPMHQAGPVGDAGADTLFWFCHVARKLLEHTPTTLLRLRMDTDGSLTKIIVRLAHSMSNEQADQRVTIEGYSSSLMRRFYQFLCDETDLAIAFEFDFLHELPRQNMHRCRVMVTGLNEEHDCCVANFHLVSTNLDPEHIGALESIPRLQYRRVHAFLPTLSGVDIVPLSAEMAQVLLHWDSDGICEIEEKVFRSLVNENLIVLLTDRDETARTSELAI